MTEIFASALYVFLFTTYLASSGTEAISSLFGWRSRMLFDGVRLMLHDRVTGLAAAVYRSPLVHAQAEGDAGSKKYLPSYIEPKSFSAALCEALGLEQSKLDQVKGKQLAEIKGWIKQNVKSLGDDENLSTLLAITIDRNHGDFAALQGAFARWFEQATNRIGGKYKRRTQLSNFVIGLVLAVVFDLTPLPPSVIALTQAAAPSSVPSNGNGNGNGSGASAGVPIPGAAVNGAAKAPATAARAVPPPAAAEEAATPSVLPAAWAAAIKATGWLVTALSTLLGAPFWFGLLSKVTNVRGTGDAPPDSAAAAAATPQVTATAQPGTVVASTPPAEPTPASAGAPPGPGSPPPAGAPAG